MKRLFSRSLVEENGGEVLEYTLMLGMLVVGVIVLFGAFGNRIAGRWQQLLDLL